MASPTVEHEPCDVLLYYKYVQIDDAKAAAAEQIELCTRMGLYGRIKVATEGINGSVAGPPAACDEYIREMCSHDKFRGIDWKRSCAGGRNPFKELKCKVEGEIVSSGPAMRGVDPARGGQHLTPQDFHEALKSMDPSTTALLDVRNHYEVNIGRFPHAIDPKTKTFLEWSDYVDKNIDELRSKPDGVLMYCTGGIRCEKASAYLKAKGVENVRQLQGGIHRYLEAFPGEQGLFRGKNFVFDQRGGEAQRGGRADEVVGCCERCSCPFDTISPDRVCSVCRDLVVCCDKCWAEMRNECYCREHTWLEGVYCAAVTQYQVEELQSQQVALAKHVERLLAEGARGRKRRRTLNKHLDVLKRVIENRVGGAGGAGGGETDRGGEGKTGKTPSGAHEFADKVCPLSHEAGDTANSGACGAVHKRKSCLDGEDEDAGGGAGARCQDVIVTADGSGGVGCKGGRRGRCEGEAELLGTRRAPLGYCPKCKSKHCRSLCDFFEARNPETCTPKVETRGP
jgi:predicted sulfurtransferase